MTNAHISILPLTGKSHIYASLGFCSELKKRGYRITFLTDIHHAPLVMQAGITPVVFEPPKFDATGDLKDFPVTETTEWSFHSYVVHRWLIINSAVVAEKLSEFYATDRPDLILYDRDVYAGRILAARFCCPAIQVMPHFTYPKHFLCWRNGDCYMPPPMWDFSELLDTFLRSYGISDSDSLWHTEALNLCLIPKEFQYMGESLEHSICFIGPCLDRPFKKMWKNRSNGKPIILISDATGSVNTTYYESFIQALFGLDYHVILSVDDNFPADSLSLLPPNFEISRHVSHLEILPHAALMISQGGMGGALAALYHGVPVIAFPPSLRYEEVAYRIEQLGLGLRIPRKEIAVSVIRGAVEQVFGDRSLKERVKKMQQVFISSGGPTVAAEKVEEYLRA